MTATEDLYPRRLNGREKLPDKVTRGLHGASDENQRSGLRTTKTAGTIIAAAAAAADVDFVLWRGSRFVRSVAKGGGCVGRK